MTAKSLCRLSLIFFALNPLCRGLLVMSGVPDDFYEILAFVVSLFGLF